MGTVGLVLGGGGVTGAAYHFGVLFALRMATGWEPDDADVIVGTSSGGFVAAMVRGRALELETLIGDSGDRDEAAAHLRSKVYHRTLPKGLMRWMRRGIVPGLLNQSRSVAMGSPGVYSTMGMERWVEEAVGDLADEWPESPTVIVAYDLDARVRAPFGTEDAPDVALKRAVAASIAVPFLYEPVQIDGRWYLDGGVSSGTSADLVLGRETPLDLIIISAPMAAHSGRDGARFYENTLDRIGRAALDAEIDLIRNTWPTTEIVVLRPGDHVLEATRPNPLAPKAAIPTFIRTLRVMRTELARPDVWPALQRHLMSRSVAT